MDRNPNTYVYTLQDHPRRHSEPIIAKSGIASSKEDQLACIDVEILRVEEMIFRLVKQRADLKRARNRFSPAVKLPPEILTLIFEFACLPTGGEEHQEGQRLIGSMNLGVGVGFGAVTPLFVGTVCSAWRGVAFGASQLWNTVTIHLNEKRADAQATLLKHWLSRANQQLLRIKVIEDDSNMSENDSDYDSWGIDVTSTAVINVLVEHSRQWRIVDLFLPSTWKTPLAKIRHNLPNLATIALRVADGSPTLSRVDAFAHAPRLRDVTIVGYSMSDIILPWAQLECLNGEYFNVDESLDTLRRCISLRKCQFMQLYRGVESFAIHPIRHELLESFELILDTSIKLHALFGAMTLPNLKELVLSLSDDEPLLGAVLPLIKRSGCGASLRRLHLVGVTPGEDELLGCLKELHGLEALLLVAPVMTGGKLTDRFLRMMNPKEYRKMEGRGRNVEEDKIEDVMGCLVPRLELLEYQGPTAFNTHTLADMLTSRWHSQPPLDAVSSLPDLAQGPKIVQLKTVTFTTESKIRFGTEDAKIINGLMEDGMHLQFLKDPNADMPVW